MLDILTFIFGIPEPPNWIPLISIPCIFIGITAALYDMLRTGECTCPTCMALRHNQKTGFLSK